MIFTIQTELKATLQAVYDTVRASEGIPRRAGSIELSEATVEALAKINRNGQPLWPSTPRLGRQIPLAADIATPPAPSTIDVPEIESVPKSSATERRDSVPQRVEPAAKNPASSPAAVPPAIVKSKTCPVAETSQLPATILRAALPSPKITKL